MTKNAPSNCYNHKWFEERAFNSLKQLDDDTWDYSDSLLLYVEGAENEYKSIQQTNNPYYSKVTAPEKSYLKKIASSIALELPDGFDYIDLGPGSEYKEQFIFDELKKQHKTFTYRPVDICSKFLDDAAQHAGKQGIKIAPILSSFEELPERLFAERRPRFVSLGLTYSNYPPDTILKMLKSIVGNNGVIFICSQLRERIDIDKLIAIYSKEVYSLCGAKLKLIGLDSEQDATQSCDDGLRIWSTLIKSTPRLEQIGIRPGARLLVVQSLRPTLTKFKSDIASVYSEYKTLDTDDSFVGVLLGVAA
jgi:hypothetical protein